VTTNEEANEEAPDHHRRDDEKDEAHSSYCFLNVTAVP
jgi:hypothetical protein